MGGNLKTRRQFVISGRFQKKLSRVYPGLAFLERLAATSLHSLPQSECRLPEGSTPVLPLDPLSSSYFRGEDVGNRFSDVCSSRLGVDRWLPVRPCSWLDCVTQSLELVRQGL